MPSRMRKRYVYDELTKTMVERPIENSSFSGFVMGDLEDFVSPVDGKIVHGRAGLREHDKRHGTTNVADYKETWAKNMERRANFSLGRDHDRSRTEAVVRAFNDLNEGRRKGRS